MLYLNEIYDSLLQRCVSVLFYLPSEWEYYFSWRHIYAQVFTCYTDRTFYKTCQPAVLNKYMQQRVGRDFFFLANCQIMWLNRAFIDFFTASLVLLLLHLSHNGEKCAPILPYHLVFISEGQS